MLGTDQLQPHSFPTLQKMLASTLRRSSRAPSASVLRHAPRNSLPGRHVFCSAPKERTVSTNIPFGVGIATGKKPSIAY